MHWTYSKPESDSGLQQGDFLIPKDELRDVLREFHPHFCDGKYIGFVITTQTCDLVRHDGKPPKAHYINIAAVRSLNDAAAQIFERVISTVSKGAFRQSDKSDARDLLHRICNQNEQALGLFYFHPDAELALGDPSVAFLRITIALRAEHYDLLLSARTGGLRSDYQAKLGWLVGNLYSRAATPDWDDHKGGADELEQLKNDYLSERLSGLGPYWIEDELIDAGIENGINFEEHDGPALADELEKYRPLPPIEKLAQEVSFQAGKVFALNRHTQNLLDDHGNQKVDRIVSLLQQYIDANCHDEGGTKILINDDLKSKVAKAIGELAEEVTNVLSADDAKLNKLSNRLANNKVIKILLKKDQP